MQKNFDCCCKIFLTVMLKLILRPLGPPSICLSEQRGIISPDSLSRRVSNTNRPHEYQLCIKRNCAKLVGWSIVEEKAASVMHIHTAKLRDVCMKTTQKWIHKYIRAADV